MKRGDLCRISPFTKRFGWVILGSALAGLLASTLSAGTRGWAILSAQSTGVPPKAYATLSPEGDIYWLSANSGSYQPSCPPATLSSGDTSVLYLCVNKQSAMGALEFSVRIGGVTGARLAFDEAGDVYVAGRVAQPAYFAATPGAYASSPQNGQNFVCALRPVDGHPLFCTYVDLPLLNFTVDPAGNTYIAGGCGGAVNAQSVCVGKLNSTGTAIDYRNTLPANSTLSGDTTVSTGVMLGVDTNSNLFLASAWAGIAVLNASGAIVATVPDIGRNVPSGSVVFDPAGNPELVLQDPANTSDVRLRRYNRGLSSIVFETKIPAGINPQELWVGIDPAGVSYITGVSTGVNLQAFHATQTCGTPSTNLGFVTFLARFNGAGELMQLTYLGVNGILAPIQFGSGTGAVLAGSKILTLGPAASEISLSCAGDSAQLEHLPLAPNELVSLFGTGLGPALPVVPPPDAHGIYPLQLGGTQVTFDGVPAPLLYVSSGQVNLVTPGALQGRTTTHICALVPASITPRALIAGRRPGRIASRRVTNCLDLPVHPAAPAVFTSGAFWRGSIPYAAALNQDGAANSEQNPALAGSAVTLFVTGLGPVTPAVPDGGITPDPPPQQDFQTNVIFFDYGPGSPTAPVYAGPAPLRVEGLGQIKVIVPPMPPQQGALPILHVDVRFPNGGGSSSQPVAFWIK